MTEGNPSELSTIYGAWFEGMEEAWHEDLEFESPLSPSQAYEFCRQLEASYGDLPGGYMSYRHNPEAGRSVCQFDFCAPLHGQPMAVRLMILFSVHWDEGLRALRVLCANDTARTGRPQAELAEPVNKEALWIWIMELLHHALALTSTESRVLVTVVHRYVASWRSSIASRVRLLPGLYVTPTVRYDDGALAVGAVAHAFRAYSESSAIDDGRQMVNRAMDIVTLALGVQEADRGRSRNPRPDVTGDEVFRGRIRSARRVYKAFDQTTACSPSEESRLNEHKLSDLGRIASRLDKKDERVWNCLAALRDAQELAYQRPSLAVVMSVAALAVLSRREQCSGVLSCTECGKRITCTSCGRRDFPHDIVGERAAIERLVLSAIPNVDPVSVKRIKEAIRLAHQSIRSGLVHYAAARHEMGRIGEVDMQRLIRPGRRELVSDEIRWRTTLGAFPRLARQVVITELAGRSGVTLDRKIWEFGDSPMSHLSTTSVIRLAGTFQVSLRINQARPSESQPDADDDSAPMHVADDSARAQDGTDRVM